MKKCIFFVLALFLTCGSTSCEFPERDTTMPFGQEFRIEYDQYIVMEDGTEVKFLELKKDSRCPEDALCPYDGEAIIAVALDQEDRLGTIVELKIPGLVDRYGRDRHIPVEHWGYKFILLQLDPYPLTDHIERKYRYVATMKVLKVNGEEPE